MWFYCWMLDTITWTQNKKRTKGSLSVELLTSLFGPCMPSSYYLWMSSCCQGSKRGRERERCRNDRVCSWKRNPIWETIVCDATFVFFSALPLELSACCVAHEINHKSDILCHFVFLVILIPFRYIPANIYERVHTLARLITKYHTHMPHAFARAIQHISDLSLPFSPCLFIWISFNFLLGFFFSFVLCSRSIFLGMFFHSYHI